MDKEPLVGLQAGTVDQGHMGRLVGQLKGGSFFIGHVFGQNERVLRLRYHILGTGGFTERHHPVADLKCSSRTGLHNLAGGFDPGDEGQGSFLLVFPGNGQNIQIIQPNGLNLDNGCIGRRTRQGTGL